MTTEIEEELENVPEYQLDVSYRNLDRLLAWVAGADNKALIGLTFEGVMIVGLATTTSLVQAVIFRTPLIWQSIVVVILLLALLACLCITNLKLFHTIAPRIVRREREDNSPPEDDSPSLLFFGSIAGMEQEEYAERMRTLNPVRIQDALVRISHVTARIADQKYADLAVAYRYLGYQVILFAAVLLVSLLAPSR